MRRAALFLCAALAWPIAAQAGAPEFDVRAVQTDSTDVFEVLQTLAEAQAAFDARDYPLAQAGFESVLLHDHNLRAARKGLRRTFLAMGNVKQAAPLVEDPNSADGVMVRILSGQADNPEALLKTTLTQINDARLWTLLGRVQDQAGQHNTARQSFAMVGLAGARAGLAENNIGQSHLMAGETQAALEAFSRAVTADPSDRQFDNNRRRALIFLGRTAEAVAGLGPDRAGLFLAQAGDHAALTGETRLAELLYRKSLELSPRHNPRVAEALELLDHQARDANKNTDAQR